MKDSLSTIDHWLNQANKLLVGAGIATARLDSIVLLEDALKKERSYLLAHPEVKLPKTQLQTLNAQLKRRANHEPLAYIRGKSEFYGREFLVNKHTLQPRPETETMIELLKQLVDSRRLTVDSQLQIADVGTGSGCLAITAKLEFPKARVLAMDISPACIKIAEQNAQQLGADIEFFRGDLLEPLLSAVDCKLSAILANLPYVPASHTINEAAMQEPKIAIFGGHDGLVLYRRLFAQLQRFEHKPRCILTESLPPGHEVLEKIARSTGYKLARTSDFVQIFIR